MLRFYTSDFVECCQDLQSAKQILRHMGDHDECDENQYQSIKGVMVRLFPKFLKMNMHISMDIAHQIANACENRYLSTNLRMLLDQLSSVIQSELKSNLYLQIPKERSRYYDVGSTLFNGDVSEKFPAVITDMEEAAKCFALGRNTACVFHLMRVMESSIQRLGKKLKVKLVQEKVGTSLLMR